MHQPLVFQVLLHLGFDRPQTRQHVLMRMHHTFRLARCSRSKHDLQRIALRQIRNRPGAIPRNNVIELLDRHRGTPTFKRLELLAISQNQDRRNFALHAPGELHRARKIERHRKHPSQHTAKKRADPSRAVLAPKEHPVSFLRAAVAQLGRKPPRKLAQFSVTRARQPQTAPVDNGNFLAVPLKIVYK